MAETWNNASHTYIDISLICSWSVLDRIPRSRAGLTHHHSIPQPIISQFEPMQTLNAIMAVKASVPLSLLLSITTSKTHWCPTILAHTLDSQMYYSRISKAGIDTYQELNILKPLWL